MINYKKADEEFRKIIIEGQQFYFKPNGYEIMNSDYLDNFEVEIFKENEPFIAQDKIY